MNQNSLSITLQVTWSLSYVIQKIMTPDQNKFYSAQRTQARKETKQLYSQYYWLTSPNAFLLSLFILEFILLYRSIFQIQSFKRLRKAFEQHFSYAFLTFCHVWKLIDEVFRSNSREIISCCTLFYWHFFKMLLMNIQIQKVPFQRECEIL